MVPVTVQTCKPSFNVCSEIAKWNLAALLLTIEYQLSGKE